MTKTQISVPTQTRARFGGALLQPSDDGYDDARRIHNGMIDKRPGLIARCSSTADVVEAVGIGRRAGVEVAVRGGGHNVAGKAVTDGGLMIDLAPMRAVDVDPTSRTVRAEAGVTWGELNDAAAMHGLATTGGQVSTTGVAGLTLGGGLGYLMGKHGLAADNLISAEVVTAAGDVLTASEADNEELFWAIRGGGGNFGVVTAFTFRVHPLTTVLGGILAHPLAAGAEAFDAFRKFTAEASDDVGIACGLVHAPDGSGQKIAAMPLCHAADDEQRAAAELKPLRAFGPPVLDVVDTMPYPVVNTLLDGGFPKGALSYWKSAFLTELSDELISTLVNAYTQVPSPMSALIVEHLHGAATRVDPTATAYPHRQAGYNVLVIAQWADPADTQANIGWARTTFDSLRPYLTDRRYMNYMSADDAGFVREAYGANYDRLVAAKRMYDPGNLFRLNQNIAP
ncbi:MAG: FAD-binding oxidoreductase [Mycobacteriales bacterium]|nr:FAD-binding oxidoreductase [Frankia sp.]